MVKCICELRKSLCLCIIENMSENKLYAIGIGAGNPDFLTIETVKALENCTVIVCPETDRGKSVAEGILQKSCVDLAKKQVVKISFPMIHDKEKLALHYEDVAKTCTQLLEKGENVALITIGDVSFYSTAYQVASRITGFCVEYIAGITSISAVAALAKTALVSGNEALHVIPADFAVKSGTLQKSLELDGTKVLMKMGKSYEKVLCFIYEMGLAKKSILVQNCSMEGERILFLKDYKIDSSELYTLETYFSIIIVKDFIKE